MGIGNFNMTPPEIRVLGCLMEKQRTTPDVYPLTMNALRLACNQSTNRDPVLEYEEQEIRMALHHLERRGLTRLASGAGSRTAKYRHLLAQALPMEDAEQAILCVLMLRGPQTPGELKQRAERMHAFSDLGEVQETLHGLIERGLVERMERRPGQKEERHRHLLSEEEAAEQPQGHRLEDPSPAVAAPAFSHAPEPNGGHVSAAAVAELLERVARLEAEVAELRGMRDPVAWDTT